MLIGLPVLKTAYKIIWILSISTAIILLENHVWWEYQNTYAYHHLSAHKLLPDSIL